MKQTLNNYKHSPNRTYQFEETRPSDIESSTRSSHLHSIS